MSIHTGGLRPRTALVQHIDCGHLVNMLPSMQSQRQPATTVTVQQQQKVTKSGRVTVAPKRFDT